MQKNSTPITWLYAFLLILLFCQPRQLHAQQLTYDFSTAPTIVPGTPWSTQAKIVIGGITYLLSTGGNGSFVYSSNGGNGNSASLNKASSSGDSFTLERLDGQPFNFYGIWIREQGINSYDGFNYGNGIILHLPPFYKIHYNRTAGAPVEYDDTTPKASGAYTDFSKTISANYNVTSVYIEFPANNQFWIDDIIVSSTDQTTVQPITGNTITAPETSTFCSSGDPAVITGSTPGGGTGTFTYQWQSSTNNSTFTNISGATSASYDPPVISATTYFRRTVSSGTATPVQSNTVTLTVQSAIAGNTITAPATASFCGSGDAGVITGSTPSGGSGTYTYQWQSSTDNSNFTNINGATSASYDPPSATATTYYRRSVTSGACTTPSTSNVVTITIQGAIASNTITAPATVSFCGSGDAAVITGGTPTGGTGTYTYQWQSSTDNSNFTNINGATSASYDPPSATVTTYYRRNVTSGACTTPSTSNVVTITIQGAIASNTITAPATSSFCGAGDAGVITGSTPTGGSGTYTYQWQSSADNSTFTNINGATSASYDPPSASVTTYYRRLVTSGACTTASTSGTVTITIQGAIAGNTISTLVTSYRSGDSPFAISGSTPTGGSGSFTYQWQSSTDGTNFTNISAATSASYTVSSLGATTYFRRSVVSGTCTTPSLSNVISITATTITLSPATLPAASTATSFNQSFTASGGTTAYTFAVTSGALPAGLTLTTNGTLSGTPTASGSFTFTITAKDAANFTGSQSYSLTVGAPTITLSPTSLSAGTYQAAYSTAISATGGTAPYNFIISTGALPTGLSISPSGTISGTPTVSGTFNFTVQATDATTGNGPYYATQFYSLSINTVQPLISLASQATKTYGNADFSLGATSINTGTIITYSSNNTAVATVTADQKIHIVGAGTATITASQAAGGNYAAAADVQLTLTVDKATVAVAADAKSKIYGDADPALTYHITSGALVGTDTFSGVLTRDAGQNTGIYTINKGTLALSNNYTLNYTSANLTISAKPLTINAIAANKTYGDADPALTYTVSPSLINGDTFTGSLSRAAGENVGIYTINQGTLAAGSNYAITFTGANFTIGAKSLTINATAKTKIYGDADPALTYTFSPALITGDGFTGSLSRASGENVGAYAISKGTLTAGANYVIVYNGANLTIEAKALTINATARNKTYGDADPALTYTSSPALITGDSFTGSLTRAAGENIGTYAISQGTLTAGSNYTVTYNGANLTIGTKAITVTAVAKNKTYGDADPALTYTVSPALITGDSFTGVLTRAPGENIGTYAITQGTLSAGSNYTITYAGANLTIGTKAITVTAIAKSKTYGDADPLLTYTVSPALITGDSFTGSLTRAPGENIGTYAITQGTLSAGTNYAITYTSANLAIGTKPITITAAAKSKIYGDTDPALTYAVSPALVTGDSFTGALTRAPGENIGTYVITQGTLSAGSNYAVTYAGANLAIGTKAITVTAIAKNKTYGDADPALTYTVSPALISGDSFTGSLTRAAGENIGTYAITRGTLGAGANYTITYTSANLTIGTKAITVTAVAKTKNYGDADPTLTYTVSPALVTGDSFTGPLTRTAGENIGTYAINQGTLSAGSNYAITYTGANLTIGTKAITVTAIAKTKTYGDADPALTYTFSPALITGDAFTGSLTRAAGENVGTYAITQGTLSAGSNYAVTYTGANLSIGAKAIAITAAAKSKIYGDADPGLTYTFAPALITGDAFTGVLTRDAGENIGTYAIKQGTLALSSNYTTTYTGANLTIGKKAIAVTATAKTKVYGSADPALTYTFSPALVTGDSFTGGLTRDAGESVGTYAIKQGSLTLSSNYDMGFTGANFAITKATLTITADNQSKTYGQDNPALTFSYSGFVTGDSESSLTTKPTIATTAVKSSGAGSYPITVSGAATSNYTLVYNNAALTVNKAVLNVTADDKSRNYGVVNPALTVTYNGFVNNDTQTSLTTQPTATTNATATSAPGKYPIVAAGGVSANYTFNYSSGTLTVIPLTNADLSALSISNGSLSPSFAPATLSYSASEAFDIDRITVTPTFDPTATITINGSSSANGRPSQSLALNAGNNLITLVVTAQDGTTRKTYTINVYRAVPPETVTASNILSPNGDGKNDKWIIKDIELYPNNTVTVFDRGGRTVFSKRGYNNEWDGTLKGMPLSEGTYFYVIDLGVPSRVIKGYITILKTR